ncbi:methylamine utilization protein [Pseudoalteromonas sp. T1lg65]|uniref:methylamine utilization protein n=1 Tax=Pseudoalteromonas sp. T1lg65 TaxID=2077101 RepID=UPI003F7A959E
MTYFAQAKSYFLLVFLGIVLSLSSADARTIQVLDSDGAPLQHAVIELTGAIQVQPSPAIMDQMNKQFVPHVLAIHRGQQVSFPNSDDIRHHVYSFSQAKPFELKLYAGMPKAPITFENSGIVVLGCNIHDSMVGYIYVADSSYFYITDKNGRAEIPDNHRKATIWHPNQTSEITKRKAIAIDQSAKQQRITVEIAKPAPRNTFGERFGETR